MPDLSFICRPLMAVLLSLAAYAAARGADDLSDAGGGDCRTPTACAAAWEENASRRLQAVVDSPADLAAFLKAMPKGGDLHNHLIGAVYAETFLGWAKTDDDCLDPRTDSAVAADQCLAGMQAVPTAGPFYDRIVRAWSMQDFVAGRQSGHDHFFATFGKFAVVVGAHRDASLADVVTRAADENELYVEAMFDLGKNLGKLAGTVWTQPVTAETLPAFYDALLADPGFAARLASDVAVVNRAGTAYRATLGCAGVNPPAACRVGLRLIAQVTRTSAPSRVFGQLVSAYEMAAKTPLIVGVNLANAEDDARSLANYDLHMAMLDLLYRKYTVTKRSPLHVALHAGELAPELLPAADNAANTSHVRRAVELGHAERIGHGVDILAETDPVGLMREMRARNVLVEICLSSNDAILNVSGARHPLRQYLQHAVPVALATDDQGVTRTSMAGEYRRAVLEQKLTYRQLKMMARRSLEHAFLPGASLWRSLSAAQPVADCAPTGALGLGDPAEATCQTFLATSERARLQWELEARFLAFERRQPSAGPKK